MAPRLLAVIGPRKGATFALSSAEARIGRNPANEIAIADGSMSREHSLIRRTDDAFVVRDLGSLNGTFVNGTPVQERRLAHGDEIGVGASLFVFLSDEESKASSDPGDEELSLGATIELRPEEAVYLDPARLAAVLPAGEVARDVDVLLRATRAAASALTLEDLARQLLGFLGEAIRPPQATVVFLGTAPDDVVVSVSCDETGKEPPGRISRTLLRQLSRERAAVLSNDVTVAFPGALSLLRAQIRALAAAPIVDGQALLGLLCVASCDDRRFAPHDLQLLTALAETAARAATRLRRWQSRDADYRRLRQEAHDGHPLVGESAAMAALGEKVRRVAPTDSTVLVLGESGTGKELVARALHSGSRRADGPFVAINCGALTDSLLESELFGHEKGAFTGALARKRGRLELGDGGTVFLDEVGELPPNIQTKLLRFLQEREIDRVGGTTPIKIDVRLIAATNRDLAAAVKAGQFREDLYYRLNVVALTLPPLRERDGDVRLLATYFVVRHARRANKKIMGITPEAWEHLLRYDWPGNVRELENAIERAVVLGLDEWLRPEDLPETLLESAPRPAASPTDLDFHARVNAAKIEVVQEALAASGGVVTEAARQLGLHPNYLHRLMRNLGLRAVPGG